MPIFSSILFHNKKIKKKKQNFPQLQIDDVTLKLQRNDFSIHKNMLSSNSLGGLLP